MRAARTKDVRCLCDWEPQARLWLWPGRIAAGKLTLIDGDPSQGKSLLTLDLVARLTTARPLPDGPGVVPPISAILIGSEDGLGDTVRPRLQAAGADLTRVHTFGVRQDDEVHRQPLFPLDRGLLREALLETNARLVIIDPLAGAVGGSGLSGPQIRHAVTPLAALAEETGAAIVMVRHLTKGGRGQIAIYRGTGAIDLIGCARAAFLVAQHPDDDGLRVLACTKINVAEPPPALGFRIVPSDGGESIINWTGEIDISADELVLPLARPHGQAVEEARSFIENLLRDGPRAGDEIHREARAAGIPQRTLQRPKADLNIQSEQVRTEGITRWLWRLPPGAATDDGLGWPERHKRDLEQAQKESDEFMARVRAKYGNRQ